MVARAGKTAAPLASLAALGVVFGDIGTSPLYALSTSFGLAHDEVDRVVVYGTTSMVIWSITLVVTVLYVGILLRFDNEGEGGLLALLALLRRARPSIRLGSAATVLAIIGAAMFLGDSLITPAISVLSAVEGLETVAPGLTALVVPITVAVLFGLFLAQRFVSLKKRTEWKRCSSMPSIRGRSASTSASIGSAASFKAARTIDQDTPNAAAVSETARPDCGLTFDVHR